MDAWENLCKKEFNFIKQERIKGGAGGERE